MGHSLFHAAAAPIAVAEESHREGDEDEDEMEQQSAQEIVHREQLKHHVHQHNRIHQRKSPADTSAAIIQVTTTVSVIQQVDVDTAGSIFSTQDVLKQSSTLPATTDVTTSIEPDLTSSSSITASALASTVASTNTQSTITTTSQPVSGLTSTHSTTGTTTFATITAGSNSSTTSTTSSTSSGSLSSSINFSTSNTSTTRTSSSSSLSSSSTSVTSITSLSSALSTTSATESSNSKSSTTSFISSTQSSSTSTETFSTTSSSIFDSSFPSATVSDGGAFGTGGTGTSASSAATSTAASGAGNSGSGSSITTPTATVIGSVFGGIAGVGLILMVLLFLVKWYKRRLANNQAALGGSSDEGARDSTIPVNRSPDQGMSERSRFAIPAGLANLGSFRPNRFSRQTMATVSSTAGSEHGFVRVAGRKIQSVLESGGDGWGDGEAESSNRNMNVEGTSFYQDSRGIYGGSGSGVGATDFGRGNGLPNLRPSPARTPTIAHGNFSELDLDQPPSRPDGGGRSRPSYEGSNAGSHASASRFTEDV